MDIMDFISPLISGTVLGALVGSVLTYLSATRDLSLRRRMATIDIFLKVSARAHGYADDRGKVGIGEQVAAVYLLADLANRDVWLRHAAIQQLKEVELWAAESMSDARSRISEAVKEAQKLIK